ncbi:DUF732 domain-containing protein [Candidatus Mycobacterium methanotrophicum]|uniref:DUF732 domain-containing protein n=1 Tax=Candidatus Mycobacterium methanotrophicum TaxID=2943498 RepID=A0ABY4QPP9_9MYCO|nr:DUF732 domain-containing protein [Candidatus Mycobacterium methanotrophicum]UQX12452.1 DUF732 domain-containing protein [Candidatus Mycobacterium methanotrophicum]
MLVVKLLLAAVGVISLAGFAAVAHADDDSRDDNFLQALHEVGIGFPSADQAIASGKGVCSYIIAGRHPFDETVQKVAEENPQLSPKQALQFVDLAKDAYCPPGPAGGGGGG